MFANCLRHQHIFHLSSLQVSLTLHGLWSAHGCLSLPVYMPLYNWCRIQLKSYKVLLKAPTTAVQISEAMYSQYTTSPTFGHSRYSILIIWIYVTFLQQVILYLETPGWSSIMKFIKKDAQIHHENYSLFWLTLSHCIIPNVFFFFHSVNYFKNNSK